MYTLIKNYLLKNFPIHNNSILSFLYLLGILLWPSSILLFKNIQFASNPILILISVISLIAFLANAPQNSLKELTQPNLIKLRDLIAIIFFLAIVTYLAFFIPMEMKYWIGLDEPVLLGQISPWYKYYDDCCARPMAGLEAYLGVSLMPDKIYGLLLANVIARFLTGFFIFLSVLVLSNGMKQLSIAAAILMIINPVESLRFTPGISLPYVGVTMYLTGAVSLFLLSLRNYSRLLLLISCAFLGVGFLHYESIFLVATILPLAVLMIQSERERTVWLVAWYAIMGFFAIRFFLFYNKNLSYQAHYYEKLNYSSILESLIVLVKPIILFVTFPTDYTIYSAWIISTIIAFALFCLLKAKNEKYNTVSKVGLLIAITFVFLALILALLPGILVVPLAASIPDFASDPTMRLEFVAAPFQAILISLICFLAASLFPKIKILFPVIISSIVLISIYNSFEFQRRGGNLNSYLDIQKESDILRRSDKLLNDLKPNEIIFFEISDDTPSPFGWGYHVFHMSCLLYGVPGYAGHKSDVNGLYHRNFSYPSDIHNTTNYTKLNGAQNVRILKIYQNNDVREIRDGFGSGKINLNLPISDRGFLGECTVPKAKRINGNIPFFGIKTSE